MMLTPKKAFELHHKLHLPEHIIEHTKKVAYVAEIIANEYIKKGIKIDKNSLICAAILHDLIRTVDFSKEAYQELCTRHKKDDIEIWEDLQKKYSGLDHSFAAYKYLYKLGFRKIAKIVKKHRFDAVVHIENKPKTIEEKIMTYADKRVLHKEIVSLKERFEDGERRYNPNRVNLKEQNKIHQKYYQMEKEIFSKIDIKPDEIK